MIPDSLTAIPYMPACFKSQKYNKNKRSLRGGTKLHRVTVISGNQYLIRSLPICFISVFNEKKQLSVFVFDSPYIVDVNLAIIVERKIPIIPRRNQAKKIRLKKPVLKAQIKPIETKTVFLPNPLEI